MRCASFLETVRPCIGKRTRRDHFTVAGIAHVKIIFGGEECVEESGASVHGAVSIREMNEEPQQVRHDRDTLSRTPRLGLLPFRFCSTTTVHTDNVAATKKLKDDALRATENKLCAVFKYAQNECIPLHFHSQIARFLMAFRGL